MRCGGDRATARPGPSATTTRPIAALTETTPFPMPDAAIQRPLRVLMLMPVDAHGRMAAVERQIRSLGRVGVDVDVVKVEGHRGLKYLETLPRFLRAARKCDLVHAHYGYCGWLARARLGKPFVVSFMGSDLLGTPSPRGGTTKASKVAAKINRLSANGASAVIVKSPEMARTLPVRAHVIPNGVDLDEFWPGAREAARNALGWSNDHRYVLFPGCPHERRKGFGLAESGVTRAARAFAQRVELMPLCDVDAKSVADYMNASDALLMTSLWEGSPNAVKEAMACNLPVVSVSVGDVSSLLEDVDASEVAPRDDGALADALVRALAEGRRSNGRVALVRKGLDLESVARRILEIYVAVVAAHQPVPRPSLAGGA
jgi:glycosyltransferase involved in cell wall biosynthesis